MKYYLGNRNIRNVGELVFGSDLMELGFLYNKKYKYWYRRNTSDILQIVGLARYSGGTYDISYICQPLYVPLCYAYLSEKRGKAPNVDMYEASILLDQMQKLGLIENFNLPIIGGCRNDSFDDILQHMRKTFEIVVKPTLISSTDVYKTYLEFRKVKKIRMDILKKNASYEYWYYESRKTCLIEILSLLDLGFYAEAADIIERDSSARTERKCYPCYEKYHILAQKHDSEFIRAVLQEGYRKTVDDLTKAGFLL